MTFPCWVSNILEILKPQGYVRIINMCPTTLVWFRLDLRITDNPALSAAAACKGHVSPVFIWAPEEEGHWPPGAASRWWLHQSLQAVDASLRRLGVPLVLRRGPSLEALRFLIRESGADAVFWNRRYEPAMRERDACVEQALLSDGICIRTFNSALLFEPESIYTKNGKPFRVFTPFWRTCLSALPDFMPAPEPAIEKTKALPSLPLSELALEPVVDWAAGLHATWRPGEAGALSRLHRFLDQALANYPEGRDHPAQAGTSGLSPHLHFGEISPRQVWAACARHRGLAAQAFLRQLGWRELPTTSSIIFQKALRFPCVRSLSGSPGGKMRGNSNPGSAAAPGTRWWMPGCASCGRLAGCTTGCAWSLVRS
jgi:deoxyribodipyrimidine photo-lyase